MAERTHYEAIVVGAGPGGAAAAYELAAAGMRTLLIEKGKLPRYKVCGGGITLKVVKSLPFSVQPMIERVANAMDISWQGRDPFVVESELPFIYLVQRSKFDNFLTEKAVGAGATLMDDTVVKNAEGEETGATVYTSRGTFTADFLIGADGATGRVARGVDLMADRWALAAIESEVEADDATMEYWRDKMGLDLGSLKASYGWVFPKGDHLSVGVGGLPLLEEYGSLLKKYDERHTAARVPNVKRVIRRHGYLLPARKPGAPVQKGRVLLVGDAAGLVEAFTGEGIFWAVRSAQLAARSIIKDGDMPRYQERLDRVLMPDLLSARRWMRVYVAAPRVCYVLPKRWPLFWKAVRAILRGERRYTQIRERLGPLGMVEGLLRDPLPEMDEK